jgi:CRP-like cAMP-binding protein
VTLKSAQDLLEPEEPIKTVYFPESGICSMVVTMKDGRMIEAGFSGRESFVGTSVVLSGVHPPHRVFVQVPGAGYKISAAILMEHLSEPTGELRALLLRGVEALLIQTAQTAACNRVHEIEERLARWLLMCHDRVSGDHIGLTHEFLATMLGTRRSTVSLAAAILQKAGFIDHRRGQITVKNRAGLEETSCECYAAIRSEYERLGLLSASQPSAIQ